MDNNFYRYFVAVDFIIQVEPTAGTVMLSLCQKFGVGGIYYSELKIFLLI